jgi:hypothetical protein
MTRNLYAEYEKLQKRIEQVGDPQYASELRRKSIDLEMRIKTLIKEQKTL